MDDLKLLAALEGGLEPEREPEGPTMMGREARELMLSGQGDKALQLFKVTGPRRAGVCTAQTPRKCSREHSVVLTTCQPSCFISRQAQPI